MKARTQAHKDKIGRANTGRHLNRTNAGTLVIKGDKKLCSKCKTWKTFDKFTKRYDRPLGLRSKCKECSVVMKALRVESIKLTQYKSGAKKRGIDFNLSKDEFMTFWQMPCYYCASEIETIGLDRINSELGYYKDNLVSACAICNVMKLALPRDVFIEHCYKITRNQSND